MWTSPELEAILVRFTDNFHLTPSSGRWYFAWFFRASLNNEILIYILPANVPWSVQRGQRCSGVILGDKLLDLWRRLRIILLRSIYWNITLLFVCITVYGYAANLKSCVSWPGPWNLSRSIGPNGMCPPLQANPQTEWSKASRGV
jgi:hypothetical protein